MKRLPFGAEEVRNPAAVCDDRADRVAASLPVLYGPDYPEHSAMAENISEGGLFIRTNDVFPVGVELVLRIAFPRLVVERRGEVTWAIHVPERDRHTMICGMGVHFTDTDACWSTFFRNWKRGLGRSKGE
jgi:Tfp pilus assembly protein PilZ